ncbi:MAG: type I restriction-modification protein subunit M [Candidatus Syntrophoarchaeum caldarius]|uniref:site-specific DNA-methyltransferase (adenine-specific) n=1 Tax=Candidatus Syntropharchaeum caldarium TaxID=1838285 RepID=A0A1F2PBF2_9EURY|nr:MAG: type I restriction-modification protein subunit M [Candidatus Syntrophoarchaeum caldarius]
MDRQQLKSKFKQACDLLRNEIASVNYIVQLSWMLFLKLYDELEDERELKAELKGEEYQRNIPPSYRWKDWIHKDWRSEELIDFINNKLFPFLSRLDGDGEKELIATIFSGKEIQNFLKDGYKLREVALLLDELKFRTREDIYVISALYEELLPEIGEMGKYAGEYYTPRPIIRLMVKIVNPRLGEKILDPFLGSSGFLIESYSHILKSIGVFTTKGTKILHDMFYGQDKKDIPYLIGIMNLLLHDLPTSHIYKVDTFADDIRKIQEKEKVDIILTNPPFGGKFDERFKVNFPVKSSNTELMALQYVMRKIKQGGRVGIVVPEGVLSNTTGPFVRVRKELLENYNVHTIVSLPKGVFTASGKTPVKTNLLFFDKTGPAEEIWYYEIQPPEEMKNFTKTRPMRDEDWQDCYEKWQNREVSENSWIVKIDGIDEETYELTPRNPNKLKEKEYRPAGEILEDVLREEKEVMELFEELQEILR